MRLRFPEGGRTLPLVAAGLALLGSLGATWVLYRAAGNALNEAQEARLLGAGQAAALLFADVPASQERLLALMEANALDGAYLVDGELRVLADATGPARRRIDLLRTDPERIAEALGGRPVITGSYSLGDLEVATGYFPVRTGPHNPGAESPEGASSTGTTKRADSVEGAAAPRGATRDDTGGGQAPSGDASGAGPTVAGSATAEAAVGGSASSGVGEGGAAVGASPLPTLTAGSAPRQVLALEIGTAFAAPRRRLRRALGLGVGVSVLGAVALAIAAARWAESEKERRLGAARAAHGAAVTQMAAMAAHEFRNPLGVVRGTVELMQERSGKALGERDQEDLRDILHEVGRMRRLTDDFLELSVDRQLHLAEVDLDQVLQESARSTEATFPAIRVRYESRPLPPLRADGQRLRQVFSNLLANAAQAQGQGELELVALLDPDGRAVRVEVRDKGPGIPQEIRARLFDPFVTGKSDGTGLGLALSRRLLERHGGTLQLQHAGPEGTTFEARLPLGGHLAG